MAWFNPGRSGAIQPETITFVGLFDGPEKPFEAGTIMALTHIQITKANPKSKIYKLLDSDSLYLLVKPSGTKLWRMNYRYLGRQKTLHFGQWPATGIAAARERRDEARRQLAAALDPAAEKRARTLVRKIAAENSFRAVAEEWVAKNEREGLATVTLAKIRWLLGMAYPMIGSSPISSLTALDALAVLRKVEATGRYESARRMRSVLSRVADTRAFTHSQAASLVLIRAPPRTSALRTIALDVRNAITIV